MVEAIKKFIIDKKMLFASMLFVLGCVFPLFIMEYSTDSYHFALYSIDTTIGQAMLNNGRFVPGLVIKLLSKMGFGIVGLYYFSLILAIFTLSLAIYELYKLLRGHMWKYGAYFLAIVTVFNPFTIEFFLFIEKGFFCFAILMTVLSAKFFIRYLRGEKRVFLIFSYACLPLGVLTYQLISVAFITISAVFIVIYSRSIKGFIAHNAIAGSIFAFAYGIGFVALKCYNANNVRMSGGIKLTNILKYYFITERWWVILIYLALLIIVFSLFCLYGKIKYENAFDGTVMLTFAKCVYVFVLTTLCAALPFIFVNPAETWLTMRTAYALGVLPGSLAIWMFYKKHRIREKRVRPFHAMVRKKSIPMLIAIIVEIIFFHTMIGSRLVNNKRDADLCYEIGAIIEEYESETGITVEKINIYYDSKIKQRNKGVLMIGDCNVRAFSRHWSDVSHMNHLLDRSFKRGKSTKYSEYFASKDFDSFNKDEQMIFEGNTLHLCVY